MPEGDLKEKPTEAQLVARDICQSFTVGARKVDVLQGVSLEIERGEKIFLHGSSGAGKTTLMYVLAGLEAPDSGAVYVDGTAFFKANADMQSRIRNKYMGYVFQNYMLMPELTALENVLLPAQIGKNNVHKLGEYTLERVQLGHRMHHMPAELSGGEQQRVAIARALINDPEIIFADEPTGNLDSKTGGEIMDVLLELVAEAKKTLIVVTHNSTLTKLGDRTLEIRDGQIANS